MINLLMLPNASSPTFGYLLRCILSHSTDSTRSIPLLHVIERRQNDLLSVPLLRHHVPRGGAVEEEGEGHEQGAEDERQHRHARGPPPLQHRR
uniref:Transferase, transferring glycosyl groups n=1 Tax=Arundo donax TaxID=35708 RepID=A0A0A9E749_ARUDO